ncbi:unnamed protein product [Orchesella dallaii]|uniref:Uncharacterized protein n=1 Tax=Orchesella dallaii TaxID=48710 RepID=A0ABP1Q1J3_9HEXA
MIGRLSTRLFPCVNLKRCLQILTIFDVCLSLINLAVFFFGLRKLLDMDDDGVETQLAIIAVAVGIGFVILQLICTWGLYSGIKIEDINACRSWLMAIVINVAIYVTGVATIMALYNFSVIGFAILPIFTSYKVYEFSLVLSFMKQIKRHGNLFTSAATSIRSQTQFQCGRVTPYIIAADLPPSYIYIQNRPECVENPPPFYEEVIPRSSQKNNRVQIYSSRSYDTSPSCDI